MNGLKAPSVQSLESDRGSIDSLLAESLQLDFDEIDDVEFSLPSIDNLPTLENVLNEFDGNESDITTSDVSQLITAPTPTPSISTDVAAGGLQKLGSILRHVVLQGVTAQISSAAERINSGLATAVAVAHMIAIGTSHGHILNFDSTQTLRWAHQDPNSQGAVSALSFNEDCSRLLAGYARGLIVMIDTKNGNLLRNLFDSITPNAGVLNIKWTTRPALALCSDSGGSVWMLSFTRKLGIRGCASRCLFSGARGEVCCMEPLNLDEMDNSELKQHSIVALATLSKFFVVTIRPRLKVIKFNALLGPPESLPLLSWQMVVIQAADATRTVDPVLAVARGNNLYFHQIFSNQGRISLLFLRHVQLQNNLLSLHWLGPKSISYIDSSEILHLIDVRSSKEFERIDMANAGLVYASAQFKGLATGGNVSPALSLAGSFACYNSAVSRGTQLYILGGRCLNILSIRSWSERISYLVNNQRWIEACELAIDGYRTSVDRPKKKEQAKERIIELFHDYLANRAPEFCLQSIIKCVIEINELDLLWQELWDRLHSPGLFLTLITEHIENNEIYHINPIIAQALVEFWLNLSPQKLEDIILKLDWTCLDLNQVLKAAKEKKLFKAQIYLNTHALNDYIISLIELIPLIENEHPDLGNSILVYISSCLAGRGYPSGEIPIETVQNVKHDVLRCLTSLHSTRPDENKLTYPYLRTLLQFNARETLNVISLAFQEKEFSTQLGIFHRKKIINILLEIMTPENATWSQIGCLLNFISQQLSTKCLPQDEDTNQLEEKVFLYLTKEEIEGETPGQHLDRENAWLELLSNDCLIKISLEEQLRLAEKSKCYYIVEYILIKMKQYDSILQCYLKNPQRHFELFGYIETYAQNLDRKIYEQITENLEELLSINASHLVKVLCEYYLDNIEELIQKLNQTNCEINLYEFYSNLQKYNVPLSAENNEKYLELMCKQNQSKSLIKDFIESCDNYRLDKALEIVKKYELKTILIILYEKQGDYQLAYNLSMDLLSNTSDTDGEFLALNTRLLLLRASPALTQIEREKFWFTFLEFILSRPQVYCAITKQILHSASQYVDLTKLVQLVLTTSENDQSSSSSGDSGVSALHSNNFSDIKELLIEMLSNSKYETVLMETTAKILGKDLNEQFTKKRNTAKRGLWITFVKCVFCRQRLYNNQKLNDNVLIFGICGHSVHEKCIKNIQSNNNDKNIENFCPRCNSTIKINDPIKLSQPKSYIIEQSSQRTSIDRDALNLKSPPRNFKSF